MESSVNSQQDNVDSNEIAKFERMANQWWDTEGQFKPLHKMNPVRANYIDSITQVAEKTIVDVGCGGGLLSEALAHRGANVTGLDMGEAPLQVARMHAQQSQLAINYVQTTAEQHAQQHPGKYDVVTCLEMLEHVPDPASVIDACGRLVKPGGDLFFSTINRNPKSYALTVIGAEYILKWLPKGTHEFQKFIRPSELAFWLRQSGLRLNTLVGMVFNPFTQSFSINSKDVDCNYIVHCVRPKD